MFGKPEWFDRSAGRWSLKPAGWQGRAYLGVWGATILVPTLMLVARGQWIESLVWGGVASVASLVDLRDVFKQRKAQAAFEELLYIGDQPHETAATENYELQLRR